MTDKKNYSETTILVTREDKELFDWLFMVHGRKMYDILSALKGGVSLGEQMVYNPHPPWVAKPTIPTPFGVRDYSE